MQGSGGIAFNGLSPEMMQEIQRLLDAEEKAKAGQAQQGAEQPVVAAQSAQGAAPAVEEFDLPQDDGIKVVVENGQALSSQRPARELGVV